MRTMVVAMVIGLAVLGATPAALELPPLDLPGEGPEAPPLEPPVPAVSEEVVPEGPAAPARSPFEPGGIALPPTDALVASTAVGGFLALVGFALYSRLSRTQILDHARRDEVFQLVRERPGISITDVSQATGLGWGTTVYHLDRLERAGLVASERASGRRGYFPVGTMPKDARAGVGALQQETTRSVAGFVIERPGATQTELAEALGMTASAASKQVSKLESAGLVRREREWKTVRLHPAPALAQLLAPPASALATTMRGPLATA